MDLKAQMLFQKLSSAFVNRWCSCLNQVILYVVFLSKVHGLVGSCRSQHACLNNVNSTLHCV